MCITIYGEVDSSVGIVTWLPAENGVRFLTGVGNYFFATVSIRVPTGAHAASALSPGVRRPGHDTNHPSSSSAEG
jgi:hypothetical protein